MTKESTIDVILHPVRMRIIQSLINQQLTAQQLKEVHQDIPQASLYRNIKKLVEAEVIHVVDEIPNRGAVEKVYSIHNPGKKLIGPDEMKNLSKDEHMSIFIKFFANLMGEYERYLSGVEIDPIADGVSLRQATFYLSDDEFFELVKELASVYGKVLGNQPKQGRRKRTIATIMVPDQKKEN